MEKELKIQVYLDNIRLFLTVKDSKQKKEVILEMIEEIEKLLKIK